MIDTRIGGRGRWIRLVAAPVGALALVGLAACGTATGTSTTSAATSSSAAAEPSTADGDDADSDLADYRSCLEDNGVTMPAPPSGGVGAPRQGGTPPSGAPAAGGEQGGTPPSGAPAAGGEQGGPGGKPGQAPPGVDATTWAAAQKACADLAPTPPDGSAPTASSVS
ncbi:MAG: hypothetical protein JNM77_00465 [Pseudonocardia sp.]|nr:hypothetical protein [Pseudonocardia sp.]